jgi:site-specific recombinase XerD
MINIQDIFNQNISAETKKLEHGISLIDDIDRWSKYFLDDLKLLNRSKNTLEAYRFVLKALKEYCSIYMDNFSGLCDIDVHHCNDFLLWMENYETNKAYGSLKERIKYLADFLSFTSGKKEDFIESIEIYLKKIQNTDGDIERIEFALGEFEDYYFSNEIPLKNIDNNYIINYMANINKSTVSTMMNRRAVLHKFFVYITEEVETDCFKDILRKMKKYTKQKGNPSKLKSKKISHETKQAFVNLLDEYLDNPKILIKRVRKDSQLIAYRDVAMIMLMYRAGLRASEALSIRLCDIEDMGESYRINIIAGKGNKNRTSYIKKIYFEKIYKYFNNILTNDMEYLSVGKSGKRLDRRNLYKKITTISQTLKIQGKIKEDIKGLHIFRHFFGNEFAEKNGNIKLLQDLLGHSVITTTMIYSETQERAKQKAATSL